MQALTSSIESSLDHVEQSVDKPAVGSKLLTYSVEIGSKPMHIDRTATVAMLGSKEFARQLHLVMQVCDQTQEMAIWMNATVYHFTRQAAHLL